MIKRARVLALIPARGGSKGIKDKNIISLCGTPLISYTIKAAQNSKYVDSVVVSTDSDRIATIAREHGAAVPFLRPARLSTDSAPTIDAVLHAIKFLEDHGHRYDILVLLQPTSPLRTAKDIDTALELFMKKGQKGLTSVSSVTDHPLFIRTIKDNVLKRILKTPSSVRRQDLPVYYRINGAIYINQIRTLTHKTSFNDNLIGFVIDRDHAVDIDGPEDLEHAAQLITRTRIA